MTREYKLRQFRPVVDLKINYAEELNAQQCAAVTCTPGPALVIAGAGSGKTRTLIYRVAFLLEQGIPADRILLLTFTNKAAREMMRRAADLVGAEFAGLWGGTFHSVGARILRRHAERLGYRPNFTILDRDDSLQMLKTCLDGKKESWAGLRLPKAEALAEMLSAAANTRRPLRQVIAQDYDLFKGAADPLEELAGDYAARKLAANVMDFDDLLARWLELLQRHPDLCDHYQKQFQFILVDEYQDTNLLQSELIDLLAASHQNVMVVGDDSQSIFGWRGAEYRNIIEFPRRYPKARVFKIEINYRSTPEILRLANAAIAANEHQFHKELSPARPPGAKPALVKCQDANQQAAFVAQRLSELREEGVSWEKAAVLYRSHFHALELQLELTRRGIPFSITSGIRVFEQAHIKDVTAHLRLVCNPLDETGLKRIVLMLPGVGDKAAEKIWQRYLLELAAARDAAAGETAAPPGHPSLALRACAAVVPKKAAPFWPQLVETFAQLEHPEIRARPADMIGLVLEAGYEDYLKENYAKSRARLEDLKALAAYAQQFASTEEFLTQLSLLTNLEAEGSQAAKDDRDKVRLSTIHQAKGLEFDAVFIIMLNENLFPSARSLESPAGEEEERRLFYVAITRARHELYLCCPSLRLTHSYTGDVYLAPSRFLGELPAELLEEWHLGGV